MTIQELKVGDSASMAKTISESDVYLFAGITGDHNPAHVNEEASKQTAFGGRIVHGILSAGLISAVLAMKLAEATLAGEVLGEHPVMLLDDVLSELDDARQTYLLTRIEDKQTFVTTCDSAAFARTNGMLVQVLAGEVRAC